MPQPRIALKLDEGMLLLDEREIRLEPKIAAVLTTLASAKGEFVSRRTLIDAVWPNQVVSDDVLTAAISALRKALGDSHKTQQHILTVPKRGYRLKSAVTIVGPGQSMESVAPTRTARESPAPSARPRIGASILVAGAASLALLALIVLRILPQSKPIAHTDSIAVLPFDVFDDDQSLRHFADGLVEELIHQLAADQTLKVISRTSAFRFRDSSDPIEAIGRKLRVSMVIEGSVRREEDTTRVTVQLIDAASGFHQWSQTFDARQHSILDLQSRIGSTVHDRLSSNHGAAFASSEHRHPVTEEAYRAFLLGKAAMRESTVDGYERGLDQFLRAVEIEPDYAMAHLHVGLSILLLYQYRSDPFQSAEPAAQAAIDRTLSLVPQLADAHAVQGLLHTYAKRYDAAESAFIEALNLQENLKLARHNFGYLLWRQGEYAPAVGHLRVALEQDPFSGQIRFLLGDSMAGLGDFDQAIHAFADCLDYLPGFTSCELGMASVLRLLGRLDQAERHLQTAGLDDDNHYVGQSKAAVLIHRGQFDAAEERLRRIPADIPEPYFYLKMRLLIAIKGGLLGAFTREVEQLAVTHNKDDDIRLIAGLTAAYDNRCADAIVHYHRLNDPQRLYKIDFWDVEFGIHHLAMLSACHWQLGMDSAEFATSLMSTRQILGGHDFPGAVLATRRIDMLVAPKAQPLQHRAIRQGPLSWLAQADPVLSQP